METGSRQASFCPVASEMMPFLLRTGSFFKLINPCAPTDSLPGKTDVSAGTGCKGETSLLPPAGAGEGRHPGGRRTTDEGAF